jgi:hypothetical protein
MGCYMVNTEYEPPCFVQGGRAGDLILMLPAWKAISERVGKPVIITSSEFQQIFEGVSYVDCLPTNYHWSNELDVMYKFARKRYPNCVLTQLHGHGIHPMPDSHPSYSWSMWNRVGLLKEYYDLPLVFDRRNPVREKSLRDTLSKGRPYILTKYHGITSPFPFVPELFKATQSVFGGSGVTIVDLDKVVAFRIFDLLGVMDGALGMITTDTATLHLAAGSPVKYIALTRKDGQSKSMPKRNCVLEVGYQDAPGRIDEIESTLRSWKP